MSWVRGAVGRGARGDAGEDAYRPRASDGARYYTSRQQHGDLTVVVKRFPAPRPDDPDAPRFVMVHGIGVSSRYFHPLAAELAAHGEVHLVDLPGYGAAPDPHRDVGIEDHAAAVAAFLERSGLHDPVLVGHSMGTNVVAALAERNPSATRGVVLLAPTMAPTLRTAPRAIGALIADGFREPLRVWGITASDYLVRCGVPYLVRQLPHLLHDRLEERVARLEVPVLVIDGDHDPIVPNGWVEELAALGRDAAAHIVRGPHVIMHTDPAGTARRILDFAGAP
jgi:pimeloyl-ACP methyl ester carboxylesterase